MYFWKLGKKVHHISFVADKKLHTNVYLKVTTNLHPIRRFTSVRKSGAGESSRHPTPFTHDPAEAPQKLDTVDEF